MHELSIAQNVIDIVNKKMQDFPNCLVASIRLKIGALSCVHQDSLLFSFDLTTADTPLQGAKLIIEEIPVVVYCSTCNAQRELPGIQRLECPVCGTLTGDIRQGRELEVDSIEVVDKPASLSLQPSTMQTSNCN